jgi:glycosyltransferase involved in cell wall biosynthesis
MRVLHFAESFSLLSETFIYDYVTELERQGVDNHVVTLNRQNEEARPFPKVYEVDAPGRWHPLRLWHRLRLRNEQKPSRVSFWPQLRNRIADVASTVRPDVIHAHFGPAGVIVAPVAERLGIPLVVTFYGYDVSSLPKETFWEEKYDDLWPRVDGVTVLSEEMRERVVRFGCPSDRIEVVHLSRDLKEFSFRPPTRPVERVLFVGRLVPKKAPLDAIQAVQQANEQGADLTLDMVGDGPLLEKARRYVKEHDLSDTITIHGRLPNAEVAEHMRTADAFLLPSKTASNGDREGTPTVLVEAQATGLPCVATRHAGIPEMIPEANHKLLAPEGDIALLADSLHALKGSSARDLREIAECGRQKVERDYSLSGEVHHLQRMYREHIINSHVS